MGTQKCVAVDQSGNTGVCGSGREWEHRSVWQLSATAGFDNV